MAKHKEALTHPIPSTWDLYSEVLILGSFPSVKSREVGFYYGHPQNRFWKVLAAIFDEPVPLGTEQRRAFLLRNHIAAWDVIASCSIIGSSDSSISDVVPNNILPILEGASIRQIYTNGHTAFRLYRQYIYPQTGRQAICLPSTSPANASWSFERLMTAWSSIKEPV